MVVSFYAVQYRRTRPGGPKASRRKEQPLRSPHCRHSWARSSWQLCGQTLGSTGKMVTLLPLDHKHPSPYRADPAQTCFFASLAPKSKMVHLCRQVEPESHAYLSWKGGWEWDYLKFWLSQRWSCHRPRLPRHRKGVLMLGGLEQ